MEVYRDCFGQEVRLTDERKAHILEHPEMAGLTLIGPALPKVSIFKFDFR